MQKNTLLHPVERQAKGLDFLVRLFSAKEKGKEKEKDRARQKESENEREKERERARESK
jgi:hypothetical protein